MNAASKCSEMYTFWENKITEYFKNGKVLSFFFLYKSKTLLSGPFFFV